MSQKQGCWEVTINEPKITTHHLWWGSTPGAAAVGPPQSESCLQESSWCHRKTYIISTLHSILYQSSIAAQMALVNHLLWIGSLPCWLDFNAPLWGDTYTCLPFFASRCVFLQQKGIFYSMSLNQLFYLSPVIDTSSRNNEEFWGIVKL